MPERRDLLLLEGGAGGDRTMESAVQHGAAAFVAGLQACGPQKPLRVEICMTPGADSGLFLRLFQRTLCSVLALCEADLPCCHFEAFGSVTSAPALLSSGNCCGMDCSS